MWRWWYEEEGACLDDPETRSLMDRETWAPARVGDEGIDPADIGVADRRPGCSVFVLLFVAQPGRVCSRWPSNRCKWLEVIRKEERLSYA